MSFYECAVLFPAYENADGVMSTLAALTEQTIKGFQVVVLDDSLSDEVQKACDYGWSWELSMKYIRRQPKEGFRVASAWNILWRSANVGDDGILILTNSHILMKEDWVANHIKWHEGHDNRLVLGPYKEGSWGGPSTVGRYDRLKSGKLYQLLRCYSDSLRKKHLVAVNGWDENFDGEWGFEDVDLGFRLQKLGVEFIDGRDVEVVHLTHGRGERSIGWGKRNVVYLGEKHPELSSMVREWGV